MYVLDFRTVFTSHVITTALCAIVITSLWLKNRQRFTGLNLWAVHFWMQFVALVLILLRGVVPDLLSIVVANTLVIAGLVLLIIGLERYLDCRGMRIQNYAYVVLFAGIHTYFSVVQPDLMARNINSSFGLAFLCAQAVWLLRYRVGPGIRPDTLMAAIVCAAYGLLSTVRIGAELMLPAVSDLFQSGLFESFVILSYQTLSVSLTFALVLMVNGRLRATLKSEIIERAATVDALRLSERKFSTAFHTSPDAVNINRLSDGLFVEANEGFTKLTGYSREDVEGRSSQDIEIWADAGDRDRLVGMLRSDGVVNNFEARFRRKDGTFTIALMSAQVVDVDGEPCILSVTRDISERKQAEEEIVRLNQSLEARVQERTEELTATNEELTESNTRLDEATRAKSDFLASMSHELRTPLNSIIGFSEILARGMAGALEPEQEKQVRMIHSSGKHLLELVNEVLDLTAVEAGRMKVEHKCIDVSELVGTVVESLAPLAAEKNLDLTWEVVPEAKSLVSDRTRLEQVIFNVLGNAIKFTDHGQVGLRVSRIADEVIFTFADTGRGIAKTDIDRVFEEFYQVERRDIAKSEGTGLGLTVSRRLVELLNGTIEVESSLAKGSTFVVRIPAQP
ncbi:MAG: PAS/PAC sensor hybrid histidine [Actinobacteria bacterium]|nr:MAG: PAS/PAC sensor hybrid histidine [Actinomycetota bacterium]MDO8950298.1 ATP-binding protein [Actinomycetota bacterium]